MNRTSQRDRLRTQRHEERETERCQPPTCAASDGHPSEGGTSTSTDSLRSLPTKFAVIDPEDIA